jgi:hypothetical protein
MKHIVIALLAFLLVASGAHAQSGVARMYPSLGQSPLSTVPWNVSDPWGNPLPSGVCNGTQTSCLNEFMAYAVAQSWSPIEVDCAGYALNASATINVPVMDSTTININGCRAIVQTAYQPGLVLDSEYHGHFIWNGLINYTPSGPYDAFNPPSDSSCAVMLSPRSPIPTEGNSIIIIYSDIEIDNIQATNGLCGYAVNMATGQVSLTSLHGIHINGENQTQYGFALVNQQPTQSAVGLVVHYDYIQSTTIHAVDLGLNATNAAQISGNTFDFPNIEPQSGAAIYDWAVNNTIRTTLIALDPTQNPPTNGVVLGSSASNETYFCGYIQYGAGQTPWLDQSTAQNNHRYGC